MASQSAQKSAARKSLMSGKKSKGDQMGVVLSGRSAQACFAIATASAVLLASNTACAVTLDQNSSVEKLNALDSVISLSDHGSGQVLMVNGRPTAIANDRVAIVGDLKFPDHDVVLVLNDCGGSSCGHLQIDFLEVFPGQKTRFGKPVSKTALITYVDDHPIEASISGEAVVLIGYTSDANTTTRQTWSYAGGVYKLASQSVQQNSNASAGARPFGLTSPPQASPAGFTRAEQAELVSMQKANATAKYSGFKIGQSILLSIQPDNFGENPTCVIIVAAYDSGNQSRMINGNWALRVQVQPDGRNIVWSNNMLGAQGPEIRLSFAPSGRTYKIDQLAGGKGARKTELSADLLNDLLTSTGATSLSGMVLGNRLDAIYKLSDFPKAYRYANALCR